MSAVALTGKSTTIWVFEQLLIFVTVAYPNLMVNLLQLMEFNGKPVPAITTSKPPFKLPELGVIEVIVGNLSTAEAVISAKPVPFN